MVRTVGANIDLDGQNMIVTNIEGASGLTGTLECYHADPDGYTWCPWRQRRGVPSG